MTRRVALAVLALLCTTPAGAQTAVPDQPPPAQPAPAVPRPQRDPSFHYSAQKFYPASVLRCGKSGTVTVKISVSDTGAVTDATVQRSSGFDDIDGGAVAAVRTWRYLPAMVDGKAVPSQTAMRFSIDFASVGSGREACPARKAGGDNSIGPSPAH